MRSSIMSIPPNWLEACCKEQAARPLLQSEDQGDQISSKLFTTFRKRRFSRHSPCSFVSNIPQEERRVAPVPQFPKLPATAPHARTASGSVLEKKHLIPSINLQCGWRYTIVSRCSCHGDGMQPTTAEKTQWGGYTCRCTYPCSSS